MSKRKSWVWQYACRDGDKAVCNLCDEENNNEFSCTGGTTASIGRHLKFIHNVKPTNIGTFEAHNVNEDETTVNMEESVEEDSNRENSQPRRKRQRCSIAKRQTGSERLCDAAKTEKIHVALAKLIATNQLPISFCSSNGFKEFMSVIEPNYKACKEEAMKIRLGALKNNIVQKIKEKLSVAKSVTCTTDCWSSLAQDSYITVTAHVIDLEWGAESYILSTHEMEERHTAQNLADELKQTLNEWEITDKIVAIVTDNAKNIVNAISLVSENADICNVTCSAHSVQLAINKALKEENVQKIIRHCSKVVGHFKHSNIAKQALEKKQDQLAMSKTTLLQSCTTRWSSTYFMLDSLLRNRCPIANVIADRAVTSIIVAQSLEITEKEWSIIESLIKILKPLQIVTTLLCGDNHSPVSMVRPLIKKVLEKHLNFGDNDDVDLRTVKETLISEISKRFKFEQMENDISLCQISCFFDPRYKDLEHETFRVREMIRVKVKFLLGGSPIREINTEKSTQKSALEFLYDEVSDINDVNTELETYIAEPQLRFDLDPYEWWKARETKFPTIAELAKKYLTVPATSVMSERCFSSAGNIVTPKRNRLLPENVDTLVFLYQNRRLFE